MGIKIMVKKLVSLHKSVDATSTFRFIGGHLVRHPLSDKPFWSSYIPFVGPAYKRGGLVIYGTAQSLAKAARRNNWGYWYGVTGLPAHPLFRLYRVGERTVPSQISPKDVSFETIAIQPYEDGILAGIAGSALAAFRWGNHSSLNAVTQRITVTNFFKHSLRKSTQNDQNPLNLPPKLRKKYLDTTLESYVLGELEILKPRVVIAFNRDIADVIRGKWSGGRVFGIHDPAWLKRGGSFHKVLPIPNKVRQLHSRYIAQMRRVYRNALKKRTAGYLAKYYQDFCSAT